MTSEFGRGASAWVGHAQMLLGAIPDVRLEIEDVFGGDDRVAIRLRVTGTHQGEFLGIRPTGQQIDYQSSEIYRFRGGLIAEEWICSDTLTLLTRSGACRPRVSRRCTSRVIGSGWAQWPAWPPRQPFGGSYLGRPHQSG